MCGIFGMISKKTKPFNKRAFCTMGVRNDTRGGDSCGVFIDGNVEYGVDQKKLFLNFFRESALLANTKECQIALGHCRKASVGKVSVETAQPVVLYNEQGKVDYVLIHNGTIYNYKELAEKYIPEVNIDGLTDSQVMARIFYHAGYASLDEYNGGAVFVIYDYRINKSFIFKGESKKNTHSKEAEEERPLFYCWHNGRFVFSSILETLYAFYYEETIYYCPSNKLVTTDGTKLKVVKEYKRENCTQSKPTTVGVGKPTIDRSVYWGDEWGWYGKQDTSTSKMDFDFYKVGFDGIYYTDEKRIPMNGIFRMSAYGYVYPNKKKAKESWIYEVGFFQGRLLKHPKAFILLNKLYQEANQVLTKELELLLNMLDFNPFTDDLIQYNWYDGDTLMVPQGTWKWPTVDYSIDFDEKGNVIGQGKLSYTGWPTDYKMYTYDENKILESWKLLCAEESSM